MSYGLKFSNPFFQDYLDMVEDTEHPRIFHIWAAIGALSTALGRRCWLPFGTGNILPNQYIVLVGDPAVQKSTVLRYAEKALTKSTGTKFIASDTAGYRQGMMKAILDGSSSDANTEVGAGIVKALEDDSFMGINFGNEPPVIEGVTDVDPQTLVVHDKDKYHVACILSEFTQIVGESNSGILAFLAKLWDGEKIDYQTKNEKVLVRDPLLNLLGATQPITLAQALPSNVVGQGLLSRIILVYGSEKYKKVPRPKPPNPEKVTAVNEVLGRVYSECHGAFSESPEAYDRSIELYDYVVEIDDGRFAHYKARRQAHLFKVTMAMAAARGSMQIEASDYDDAHLILQATEAQMSEALGQFGLSPTAVVKQGILDFLRDTKSPVPSPIIYGIFLKDAKRRDIQEILEDLVTSKLITHSNAAFDGKQTNYYTAVVLNKRGEKSLDDFLAKRMPN